MRLLFVSAFMAAIATSLFAAWNDPLDPIVIATEAVASRQKPIARVLHEAGPGGWQLYDADPLKGKPIVMPKTEALKLDPSLKGVVNLPVGWEATRQSPKDLWTLRKVQ
jgi:hypothetical protein